jgi:hypothetical protein
MRAEGARGFTSDVQTQPQLSRIWDFGLNQLKKKAGCNTNGWLMG